MSDNEVAETKAAEASEAPKKAADNTTSASPVKRGPGRPRKMPVVSEAAESASTPAPAKAAKAAAQSAAEAAALLRTARQKCRMETTERITE